MKVAAVAQSVERRVRSDSPQVIAMQTNPDNARSNRARRSAQLRGQLVATRPQGNPSPPPLPRERSDGSKVEGQPGETGKLSRRVFAVGRIERRTLRVAWAEYFAWRVEVRALLKVLHG